jgi:NIMA (never in mitosis gene a)-related kinase
VSHPNIIQYKESFIDSSSQSLCLVMEYADGGDLNQKITEHVKNGTDFS